MKTKVFRRVLPLILSLVMVLGLAPFSLAVDSDPVSNQIGDYIPDGLVPEQVSTWEGIRDAVNAQATGDVLIEVTGNITTSAAVIEIPADCNVYLRSAPGSSGPHSIVQNGLGQRHFIVNGDGALSLGDITLTKGAASSNLSGGIQVSGGKLNLFAGGVISNNSATAGSVQVVDGTFNMYGGEISGNKVTYGGGGVCVYRGTFNMYGGEIIGNTATDGGAVYVVGATSKFFMEDDASIIGNTATYGGGVRVNDGGTFDMSGGEISGNTATDSGGGVYISGIRSRFTMKGGVIGGDAPEDSNTATNSGGGVYVVATGSVSIKNIGFEMYDGATIRGNTATNGGGVYVTGAYTIFTMTGGVIGGSEADDANTASTGGGVYVGSGATFDMSGGASIRGNEATESGGGVYVGSGATFDMSGDASIIGNEAAEWGGGVYVEGGTFTMTGGVIGGSEADDANTASTGGGVFVSGGTFTMYGGEISGNTSNSGGGVYVDGGGIFTMTGGEIIDNKATYGGGGGVSLWRSTFNMGGDAIIRDNEATLWGGGVYLFDGTFDMYDGEIHNNEGASGGGVFVTGTEDSTFEMRGGAIIRDNEASYGGGVCVSGEGTFTMSDGAIIRDNEAANGGGVQVVDEDATFNMGGGAIIRDNDAKYDGGGVLVSGGTFTMEGGVISGNTAAYGGGIWTPDYGDLQVGVDAIFTGNTAATAHDWFLAPGFDSGTWPKIQWASTSIPGAHLLNNYDINYTGTAIPAPVLHTLTVNKFTDEATDDGDPVADTAEESVYSTGFTVKRAADGATVYFVEYEEENTWIYVGVEAGANLVSEIPFRTYLPAVLRGMPEGEYIIAANGIEYTDQGKNWKPLANFLATIYEGNLYEELWPWTADLLSEINEPARVELGRDREISIWNERSDSTVASSDEFSVTYSAGEDYSEWAWSEWEKDGEDWDSMPGLAAEDMAEGPYEVKSLAELCDEFPFDWNAAEWPGHEFKGWSVTVGDWHRDYIGPQEVPDGIIEPGEPLFIEGATSIQLTAQWAPAGGDDGPGGGGGGGGGVTPPPPDDPPSDAYERQAYLIGSDGLVRPDANITRAEVATIFFRLITDAARAGYWTQENPFPDVAPENWFNNAVSTMANAGIFVGRPDGTFAPNETITRAEMAAVIVRFMEETEGMDLLEDQFNDITGHWATGYINAAAVNDWVQGPSGLGGPFHPDRPITRAETAAMVNRIQGRLVERAEDLLPDMQTWPDNADENAWYYFYIQSATNSYTFERRGTFENWTTIIPPRDWAVLERPDSRPEDIFG